MAHVFSLAELVTTLTGCSNKGSSSKRVNAKYVDVDPGTFETIEEAVEHFGHSYLETSISEDREYGAVIHEEVEGETRFTYSTVSLGEQHSVRLIYPNGKKAVATVHTHGADNYGWDDESFSPGDKKTLNIDFILGRHS